MKEQLVMMLKAVALCLLFCLIIAIWVAIALRTACFVEVKAYLYRLIILELLCCGLLLIGCILLNLKKRMILGLDLVSIVMCLAISSLFMALFFSVGPTTIDRSYTVYTLSDMTDYCDKIYTAKDIKEKFIDGFIEEHNESQKRIDEQLSIGNLEKIDNGYRITDKGQQLVQIFRFIEIIYPVPDESSIYPNGN